MVVKCPFLVFFCYYLLIFVNFLTIQSKRYKRGEERRTMERIEKAVSSSGYEVESLKEELIQLRRTFHQYPETGWLEFYTTGMIIEYLNQYEIPFRYGKEIVNREFLWGRQEEAVIMAKNRARELGIKEEILEQMEDITGVVAIIDSEKKGPITVLRFDIDGLPEEESKDKTRIPVKQQFCSKHEGYMHACGHDGHIAMGLLLARILYENRSKFVGEIRIIFQPAEEGVRGGKAFATGGVLTGADYFLSGHLGMGNKSGELVLGTYGFLATTKLDVEYFGVSAHAGGAPEKGKNALLCACDAVLALQTLCQDGRGASRINVGKIEAGTGRNVIADHAFLQLETRGETTEIEEELYEKAVACLKGAAMMYGCTCQISVQGQAPAAKSDDTFVKLAKQALMNANLVEDIKTKQEDSLEEPKPIQKIYDTKKFKGSEDVTYYMREIQKQGGKALYLGIGSTTKASHHNTKFDFDESALAVGVKIYLAIIEALMI